MTAIVWDQLGERVYEGGVDRGVLYTSNTSGVPWNGLKSVQSHTEKTIEPIYYDGKRINNAVDVGDFEGTLTAYTYPDEFLQFEGTLDDDEGRYVTGQGVQLFHLSWRTRIANDLVGTELGYKLHILRNVVALPSPTMFESLSIDSEPLEFEWLLTALPETITLFRPTPYLIIDSRKIDPALLSELEGVLYGGSSTSPSIPTLQTIMDMT